MKLIRRCKSVDSATNTSGIPARPKVVKGFGADMSNVISGSSPLDDDSRFDPPEYADNEEAVEELDIQFEDVEITILPDGSWDYKDETYEWAAPIKGKQWRGDTTDVDLGDAVSMVEHIDDLMISMLPSNPGDYIISGTAELYFDISGPVDEDGRFYRDDTDADFDYDSSRVVDFTCTPA